MVSAAAQIRAENRSVVGRIHTGLWQKEINVRDFIQQNYTPYEGDESFLAPATERTRSCLGALDVNCLSKSARKGVLDISQISWRDHRARSRVTSTAKMKSSWACKPKRRSNGPIMPNGGFRMVVSALKTYGYEPDPACRRNIHEVSQDTTTTACSMLTPTDVRRCRSSHMFDRASRRLWSRANHRRLPARWRSMACARLIERKQKETQSRFGNVHRRRSFVIAKNSVSRFARSRSCSRWLPAMALTSPFRQVLRRKRCSGFISLTCAAVKEQNGAAMSLGRTSTFLDIYFQRDLAAGTLTEEQAQEIIDDFRYQTAHRSVSAHSGIRRTVRGRSHLGHRVDWRHGR